MSSEAGVEAAELAQEDWVDRSSRIALWVTLGGMVAMFVVLAVAMPMIMIARQVTDPGVAPAPPVSEAPIAAGEQIALDQGCLGCHTTDGSASAGPTWLGLAGSDRTLDTGEVVVADDPYLERAILDPAAEIVEGFEPIMPEDYSEKLSDQDVVDLLDYIKSLS